MLLQALLSKNSAEDEAREAKMSQMLQQNAADDAARCARSQAASGLPYRTRPICLEPDRLYTRLYDGCVRGRRDVEMKRLLGENERLLKQQLDDNAAADVAREESMKLGLKVQLPPSDLTIIPPPPPPPPPPFSVCFAPASTQPTAAATVTPPSSSPIRRPARLLHPRPSCKCSRHCAHR